MDALQYFKDNFGKRLKKALELKGMTQSELAKKINTDKTAISKYISDATRIPRVDTFLAICKALDVPTDFFLDEKITKKEDSKIPQDGFSVFQALAILLKANFIVHDDRGNLYVNDHTFKIIWEFYNEAAPFVNAKHLVEDADKVLYKLVNAYAFSYDEAMTIDVDNLEFDWADDKLPF